MTACVTHDTIARMEAYVLSLLRRLLASAATAATTPSHAHITTPPSQPHMPRTLQRTAALRCVCVRLRVLCVLYSNAVRGGAVCTQRDVFYRVLCDIPGDAAAVQRAIVCLARTLALPRRALGVVAGSRGCVAGALCYRRTRHGRHDTSDSRDATTTTLEAAMAIPVHEANLRVAIGDGSSDGAVDDDDNEEATGRFVLHAEVRAFVVVEKHAIFHRLVHERVWTRLPCVLLTSHGFATVAARTLLRNLHHARPHLPVVGVVDYNPSGLAILLQYRYGPCGRVIDDGDGGGGGGGVEQRRGGDDKVAHTRTPTADEACAVPALRWLGLRYCHVRDAVQQHLQRRRCCDGDGDGDGCCRRVPCTRHARGDDTCRVACASLCRAGVATCALPLCVPHTTRDKAVLHTLQRRLQHYHDHDRCRCCRHHGGDRERHAPMRDTCGDDCCADCQGTPAATGDDDGDCCRGDGVSAAAWAAEAARMAACAVKVDLEALYTLPVAAATTASTSTSMDAACDGCLAGWLCQQLLRHCYI